MAARWEWKWLVGWATDRGRERGGRGCVAGTMSGDVVIGRRLGRTKEKIRNPKNQDMSA